MRERLRSERLTAAAVTLLLVGAYVLQSTAVTIVAGLLLMVGLAFMRTDRIRGGSFGVIAIAIASAMVVALRLTR